VGQTILGGLAAISTWARIEARTYDEALELLESLRQMPSALVQESERSWSIYVAADASEVPRVVYGLGVDPTRVSILTGRPEGVPALEQLDEAVSE